MFKLDRFKLLFFFSLLLTGGIAFAEGAPNVESLSGPPQAGLPSSVYEQVEVKRLANAKVLWVNFEILRELGFDTSRGLTPEIERALLDHFAFAVDDGSRPPERFLTKVRRWFSDRYGGRGMNGNLGSGRAGSTGRFNIKGFGGTPMLGPGADQYHRDGRVGGFDSAKEALWSVVLDREAPHGSVRSFLILSTGDGTETLHVREDPVRPAHFLQNIHADGKAKDLDHARVQDARGVLAEHLPVPAGAKVQNSAERLHLGSRAYIDRVADQYAFTDANRLYQGVASSSNIGIDGRLLDLSSFTALEGYPPVNQADLKPFGDYEPVQREMVWEFLKELKAKLPAAQAAALPTPDATWNMFSESYLSRFAVEMVKQTGAPEDWVETLGTRPEVQNLGRLLREIALTGPKEQIRIWSGIPDKVMTYDPRVILFLLGSHPEATAAERDTLLLPHIADRKLRLRLARAYTQFGSLITREASNQTVSSLNLAVFWKESARQRNQERDELYRRQPQSNALDKALRKSIDDPFAPEALQSYIDGVVNRNQRVYRDIDPLSVVISETRNETNGSSVRRIFDARSGSYQKIYRLHAPGDSVRFRNLAVNKAEVVNGGIELTTISGKVLNQTFRLRDDYIEFSLPDAEILRSLKLKTSAGFTREIALSTWPLLNRARVEACSALFSGLGNHL